ncbi:MAG: 50S ribosomal protein L1 [bacterium]|nr:50S ribosomal protein L1 [bacterium]
MAHGKRYQARTKLVGATKLYDSAEALELVKRASTSKFDGAVEVHIRLGIDPKKGDQQVRATVVLPHGTGKTKRVAAFVNAEKMAEAKAAGADIVGGKELVEQIKTTEKIEFDVAVATPDMMKDLASIAKLLGPRGLMPSPKNGTVTTAISETVTNLKGGMVAFKNDDTANVHQIIGRVSWDVSKLQENYATFMEAIRRAKPGSSKGVYVRSITLAPTMGPGVKVQL